MKKTENFVLGLTENQMGPEASRDGMAIPFQQTNTMEDQ